MAINEFIFRLGLAFTLGALVGLERQFRQKSAGLRTNTLVSVGSAAFVLLSLSLVDGANMGDPSRVAGQIVSGIGFLGAGVIMRTGMTVQGLNTAATIWCSAAVGTLAGAGLWKQSILVALAISTAHIILRPLGMKIDNMPFQKDESGIYEYELLIKCKEQVENHLRVLMLETIRNDEHLQLRALRSTDNGNPAYSYIEATIIANGKHDNEIEKLAGKLTLEYGVTEVRWEINGRSEM